MFRCKNTFKKASTSPIVHYNSYSNSSKKKQLVHLPKSLEQSKNKEQLIK